MGARKRILFAILLSMALSISACTGKIEIEETEPAEIHFQIRFPESFQTDPLVQPYLDAVADFNRNNPQIKVVIDYMDPPSGKPMHTLEDYIEVMEGDEPPDLIGWSPSQIHIAEEKELFRDMLPLVNKGLDIPSSVLDFGTINGKLLVLPYGAHPSAIIYNKEIFDEAQVPYPEGEWSWEQFRNVSQRLISKYGSILTYDVFTLDMLMASIGNSVLSPDGKTAAGFLDSPEAVRSVQWLNDYYRDDEDKTIPLGAFDFFQHFHDAQAGMIVGSLGIQFSTFQGENKKKLGVAPMPYFEGGKRANPVGFSGYGISRKSKHPEAAWAFIEYLTLEDNEHSRKLAEGYVPTSKALAEAMQLSSDPVMSVYHDELNYAVASTNETNPHFSRAWNDDLSARFQELMTAEDEEIRVKLHELALRLEQELERLMRESEQKAQGESK